MQQVATQLSPQSTALSLAVLALFALVVWAVRKPWRIRLRRKQLMTANEAEFFRRLERALPAYRVFPQVSFAAFLTHERTLSRRRLWSTRARFDRKIADFVICDGRTLEIVALIELDDATHIARSDRDRDALTKTAGYQTFRFQSKKKPTIAEIAALFEHSQAWVSG
jgi:very-short-patch-repair endonuclease